LEKQEKIRMKDIQRKLHAMQAAVTAYESRIEPDRLYDAVDILCRVSNMLAEMHISNAKSDPLSYIENKLQIGYNILLNDPSVKKLNLEV
jgi:hypothetical protein